jgi:glycine/D-amino acid oxidase-like deaminating enzyme
LSDDSRQPSFSTLAAGGVFGGQLDNFTRVSHAHGDDFARAMWRFGDLAYDEFQRFAAAESLIRATHRHWRLITSAAELAEAEVAVKAMKAAGLATKLIDPAASGVEFSRRVLAVQDDGPRSLVVDPVQVHDRMVHMTRNLPHLGATRSVSEVPGGIRIELQNGNSVDTEIAIITAHLGTGALVPELHDALVGIADQWSEVEIEGNPLPAGLTYSAQHTHEWGAVLGNGRVRLGGARYLRPMAGIEATSPVVLPSIAPHLRQQMTTSFAGVTLGRTVMTNAILDINPCDEIPIAGPMYGRGRLLVAAGFLGLGLSQGFLAGRCLADLVKDGRCDDLPRQLWPERLRSMEA